MSFSKLNLDLTFDILSRLPIKDLCRYRCVSKSWLSTINHTRFLHLLLPNSRKRLVISSTSKPFPINHPDLHYIDLDTISPTDDVITAIEIDFRRHLNLGHSIDSVECVGSCNGLLCLVTQPYDVVFLNPTTREYKQIRDVPNRTEPSLLCGFGYVDDVDDFRFVRIGKVVEIYSLRSDTWRVVESELIGYKTHLFSKAIYVNRAIHWVVIINGLSKIIAFDVVQEKFRIVASPDDVGNSAGCYGFGLLGGRLCVGLERVDGGNQLWVMDEYGVKESWRRVLEGEALMNMQPLWCVDGVLLLLVDMRKLAFVDLRDGRFRFVGLEGDYGRFYCGVGDVNGDVCDVTERYVMDVFVESHVSPNFRRSGGNVSFFLSL